MRALVLLAALLALPGAAAVEDYVVLHDWARGTSLVGTTVLAPAPPAPLAHALTFETDACHPRILLDLLYGPDALAADVEGVGEVALSYRYAAELWQDGEMHGERVILGPGYGHALGAVPSAGEVEVRFWLLDGADVSWDARVRGRLAIEDPACQGPL